MDDKDYPNRVTCQWCRFWHRLDSDTASYAPGPHGKVMVFTPLPNEGRCRRRAPSYPDWPQTFAHEWCGEAERHIGAEPR